MRRTDRSVAPTDPPKSTFTALPIPPVSDGGDHPSPRRTAIHPRSTSFRNASSARIVLAALTCMSESWSTAAVDEGLATETRGREVMYVGTEPVNVSR